MKTVKFISSFIIIFSMSLLLFNCQKEELISTKVQEEMALNIEASERGKGWFQKLMKVVIADAKGALVGVGVTTGLCPACPPVVHVSGAVVVGAASSIAAGGVANIPDKHDNLESKPFPFNEFDSIGILHNKVLMGFGNINQELTPKLYYNFVKEYFSGSNYNKGLEYIKPEVIEDSILEIINLKNDSEILDILANSLPESINKQEFLSNTKLLFEANNLDMFIKKAREFELSFFERNELNNHERLALKAFFSTLRHSAILWAQTGVEETIFPTGPRPINYNPKCSCWKVISWQQDPQTTIRGNIPILEPAACFMSYTDRVWTSGDLSNTTDSEYWISLKKDDPFIRFVSGEYKFAPLLVLEAPHAESAPPRFRVDALPCGSCTNEQSTMSNCPCPDFNLGCAVLYEDNLAMSLYNINNHLKESNSASKGAFFEYLSNSENPTIDGMAKREFIDKSYLSKQINVVENEIKSRDGEEVWKIANDILDPDFIDSASDKPKFRISIFRCRGCLDRVRKNHCITLLGLDMGPGC